MTWHTAPLTWPHAATAIATPLGELTGQLPAWLDSATQRLDALGPRSGYRPHPGSEAAALLATLRDQWRAALPRGQLLTVTPFQHQVGLTQGGQVALSAPNAVARLAQKLADQPDRLRPQGECHALAWLVTASSAAQLAEQLTVICRQLPLPEWCAALRRLQASNEVMHQPRAPMTPHWSADQPLCWDPLRDADAVVGATLAQCESLARDAHSPIDKLRALAGKRARHLSQLASDYQRVSTLTDRLWTWSGQANVDTLAAQLAESAPP
ncbi:TPA: hypothetical protein P2I16_004454, partial [Aeromonas salmonicida]|nr:hypothetical protein [Aeromonas salmonicida]